MAGVLQIQLDVFDRVLMILHQEYSERSHRRLVQSVSEFFDNKSTNCNWPTIPSHITSLVFESALQSGCMIFFLFFVFVSAVRRQASAAKTQRVIDVGGRVSLRQHVLRSFSEGGGYGTTSSAALQHIRGQSSALQADLLVEEIPVEQRRN